MLGLKQRIWISSLDPDRANPRRTFSHERHHSAFHAASLAGAIQMQGMHQLPQKYKSCCNAALWNAVIQEFIAQGEELPSVTKHQLLYIIRSRNSISLYKNTIEHHKRQPHYGTERPAPPCSATKSGASCTRLVSLLF